VSSELHEVLFRNKWSLHLLVENMAFKQNSVEIQPQMQ